MRIDQESYMYSVDLIDCAWLLSYIITKPRHARYFLKKFISSQEHQSIMYYMELISVLDIGLINTPTPTLY